MSGSKPSHSFVAEARQNRKRDLDEFAADLQATINKALPLGSVGYRQVAVLAISWMNDTMCQNHEKELLDVFKDCYGFVTESFIIPTNTTKVDANIKLRRRIDDFCGKWDNEDSLTIFVYLGHGSLDKGTNNYLIAGRANNNGPSLDWSAASSTIKCLVGDMLYIFDSCFASKLAIGSGPELLAAANYNSEAGSLLNTSFTRVLATQLKNLDGGPCSISHIFGKIHRSAMDNKIAQVPIHIPHPIKDSIILQKLEKIGETKPSKKVKTEQIEALEGTESRVLITIRLRDSTGMPDLIGWKQWLAKNIPPIVHPSQITVEGVFDISSSLILVALPVAIWTALPADDTAYGFVSFVRSGNRLLQEVVPLTYGSQPRGIENKPPGLQERPRGFGGSGKGASSSTFGGGSGS